MQSFKRHTAIPITIGNLSKGNYVSDGSGNDHIALSSGILINRVHLHANVLVVDASERRIVVDDGSGSISVFMSEGANSVEPGSMVRVIGRPRKMNDSLVIYPEIIKIADPLWAKLFHNNKDAQEESSIPNKEVELPLDEPVESDSSEPISIADQFIEQIKANDSGPGADVESIIEAFPDNDGETIIEQLLRSGDIFMIAPGKIKVLE